MNLRLSTGEKARRLRLGESITKTVFMSTKEREKAHSRGVRKTEWIVTGPGQYEFVFVDREDKKVEAKKPKRSKVKKGESDEANQQTEASSSTLQFKKEKGKKKEKVVVDNAATDANGEDDPS